LSCRQSPRAANEGALAIPSGRNAYLVSLASFEAAKFLKTFVEYPPSQKPASFSIDQIRGAVDAKIEKETKEQSK
jgi:arylsulfatase